MNVNKKKRKKWLKKALVLSLLLGNAAFMPVAFAEENQPAYDLDTVVVTATKVEQKVKDVAGAVTVITAADIAKMNVQTIDQALKMSAGAFDSRSKGLMATTTSVSLRGFSGTSRTLVLLDGQPLNQAYAASVSWSGIPIESIERIEVVKGSASALYGANAMGGVINIITKNPQKAEYKVSLKNESNNTWTYRIDASDKLSDKWSYQFSYEKKTSDGYVSDQKTVEAKTGTGTAGVVGWLKTLNSTGQTRYVIGDSGKNTWDEDSYRLKLQYALDDKRTLSFGVMHDKYEYGYADNGNNYLWRNGSPFSGNASVGGGKYITTTTSSFLGLPGGRESNIYSVNYTDKENGWKFNAGLNDVVSSWYISSGGTPTGGAGRISDTPSKRWNWEVQKELQFGAKDRAVVGVNYRQDWIHNQETKLTNWKNYSSTNGIYSQAEGRSRTWAFFFQDEHKINDRWSVTYGARYDSWTNYDGQNQDNSVSASPITSYPERSDSAVSPKVALLYKVDDKSSLHASWGKAFNPPDLYNMYRSWTSYTSPPNGSTGILYDGNPDLKAETVKSIEVGWNSKISEKTNVSINYFHNEISNMGVRLDMGINKPGTTLRWQKYVNAAEGRTDGVEVEISHRFNPVWSGFLNYTYQRPIISSYPSKPSLEGKLVQSVPQQMLNFGLDYKKDKLRGNLTASYVGKQYSNDDNSDTTSDVYGSYDAYFVVNTSLEYQWDKHNSVLVGVNNLFDRQYYSYYITPGRTYTMQLTHKF